MRSTLRGLAAFCAATFLWTACHYSNPHGSQALPPTTRVITEPSGATLYVEDMKLMVETPANLPEEVDEDAIVSIYKTGYVPYHGRLGDLPQVGSGTYKCQLVK